MHTHTVLQPEPGRNKPLHPAPTHPAIHKPADIHPHPNPEGQAVNGQVVEAMLVDKPFTYSPRTPPLIEECWTQATGSHTGNPDSTTDCSLAKDTREGPDTQDPVTHVTASQTYNGDLISSSYSDVVLEIGGENVVVKGT